MSVCGWRVTVQQYLDWGMFQGMLPYMFRDRHASYAPSYRFRGMFQSMFRCGLKLRGNTYITDLSVFQETHLDLCGGHPNWQPPDLKPFSP